MEGYCNCLVIIVRLSVRLHPVHNLSMCTDYNTAILETFVCMIKFCEGWRWYTGGIVIHSGGPGNVMKWRYSKKNYPFFAPDLGRYGLLLYVLSYLTLWLNFVFPISVRGYSRQTEYFDDFYYYNNAPLHYSCAHEQKAHGQHIIIMHWVGTVNSTIKNWYSLAICLTIFPTHMAILYQPTNLINLVCQYFNSDFGFNHQL